MQPQILMFYLNVRIVVPRFPIGQGSRYWGRRGRRGGGTSRAVRSRSCWRQEPLWVMVKKRQKSFD